MVNHTFDEDGAHAPPVGTRHATMNPATLAAPQRMLSKQVIAHVGPDAEVQLLKTHLESVGRLSARFAAKFGLEKHGELIGLLHDLGKYSDEFQAYIKSAAGLLNQDEDEEFVDSGEMKGKVDHSTSGAQFIWDQLAAKSPKHHALAQVLALCVASHHSGLIDCLKPRLGRPVEDGFSKRMGKPSEKTHLQEVMTKADPSVIQRASALLDDGDLLSAFQKWLSLLHEKAPGASRAEKDQSPAQKFQQGLLVRALFSCLIDADRIDSADFEYPVRARQRQLGAYEAWAILTHRLELHIARLPVTHPIDGLRRDISEHCRIAALRPSGIYTLTVPTGGGKTLASLRFALHHAKQHGLDRIIYVIPFTSIIDQNAEVVRRVLEPEGVKTGSAVLEHHSNLTPDKQGWRSKMLSENWDAPVVYTTTVHLLETLFGSGTRGARRMHQLANSVLIFDEIQSLPINCVHLFNNAMNFLADHCKTTVVLCTATQPLLHKVNDIKGAIRLSDKHEIMPNVGKLFDDLKRVDVVHHRKPGGWSQAEVADMAIEQVKEAGSCLVIVNTKKAAQAVYHLCCQFPDAEVFHLSTGMCPAHRKSQINRIRLRLHAKPCLPTLCVSTQLIEAGVDVDFAAVVRYAAGLDSIAQAAGRCNRNGHREKGMVYVVNPRSEDENLSGLHDIRIGKEKAEGVLIDFAEDPARFGRSCISPLAMGRYYQDYFFARAADMSYPLAREVTGRDDDLLGLLGANEKAASDYALNNGKNPPPLRFRQSFMTAAKAFKAINAPTEGVIVPYSSEGRALIADLCAAYLPDKEFELLRRAQQYSVNVFAHQLEALSKVGAVREIREGTGILYLADSRYYSVEFGLSDTPSGLMEDLNG